MSSKAESTAPRRGGNHRQPRELTAPPVKISLAAQALYGGMVSIHEEVIMPRGSFAMLTDATQRLAIKAALRACGGNKSAAARWLGLHRNSVEYQIARLWPAGEDA